MADFGLFMFPTDYAIQPVELAIAAEERGFESMFFPEHTHIPTSRKTPFPGGTELPKEYWHTHDPFVALGAAAAVTKKLKLGTGVCLVIERDPIVLAKEVASLDMISKRPRAVRNRRRMERRGDGESRRELQEALEDRAREDPRDARDLDQGSGRVSRRDRQLRQDLVVSETGAAGRPAGADGLAIAEDLRSRRRLLRRMAADQQSAQRLARAHQATARCREGARAQEVVAVAVRRACEGGRAASSSSSSASSGCCSRFRRRRATP